MYCSLAGLICRVPVVSVFHGAVDVNPNSKLLRTKFHILNRGSAKVVCVSQSLSTTLLKSGMLERAKSIIIYNGIDTHLFRPQPNQYLRDQFGLAAGDIVIGAMGNIRRPKGYDILLRAAALLVKKSPRYKFMIAGEGSGHLYQDLLKLREDLGLTTHVFFLGFQEDVARVLNNFDVFLLSSTSEGFSIATIEAMACGLPVIGCQGSGAAEVVTDGKTGRLVPGAFVFTAATGAALVTLVGGGFVPANTQSGVWLCHTRVCPAIRRLLLKPKFTKASAGPKS